MSQNERISLKVEQPSEQEAGFARQLQARIVGQENAKTVASRAYRRFLNPLRDKGRPVFTAYLLGESGVGKSLTAKTAAQIIHGDPTAMIKINASNYKEPHRISQLLGAPPSYIGYKDPTDEKSKPAEGQADTSAKLSMHNKLASRKGSTVPVTIVLIDEAEKMSPELEQVFLSIFEDGEVDFGNNTVGDFTDCIFFLTGNVAAEQLVELFRAKPKIGFSLGKKEEISQLEIEKVVQRALSARYAPEFLNRIDEVVIYERLTEEQKGAIVDVEIAEVEQRIVSALPSALAFEVKVDQASRDFILAEALKGQGSARNIRQQVSRLIEEPLGNELIKSTIKAGDLIEVTYEEGDSFLSFYRVEGQGQVKRDVAANENPAAPATQQAHAEHRVTLPALSGPKAMYFMAFGAESKAQLSKEISKLLSDLLTVLAIELLDLKITEQPLKASVTVKASEPQAALLKARYPFAYVTQISAASDDRPAA